MSHRGRTQGPTRLFIPISPPLPSRFLPTLLLATISNPPDMPFNPPLKKSAPPSRRSSSPAPSARPGISTNASTCSTSTSASETSSLEAAPIRPPPGEGEGYGFARAGYRSRSRTAWDQGGSKNSSGLAINTDQGSFLRPRKDSTTSLRTTQRTSMYIHSPAGVSQPTSRESSTTRSPVTPRARAASSQPTHPTHNPTAVAADPEARYLFTPLRASSSGPDLAELRRRAREGRSSYGEGSTVVPEERGALGRREGSLRGGGSDRGDSPPRDEGTHPPPPPPPPPSLPPPPTQTPPPTTTNTSATSTQITSRRAVGLQDFLFGEVIGEGSYSTVRLRAGWGLGGWAAADFLFCFVSFTFTRSFAGSST